eukprot:EST46544.1 Hypothetical protein SS50377_fx084 [Spironucleus salmonicida]
MFSLFLTSQLSQFLGLSAFNNFKHHYLSTEQQFQISNNQYLQIHQQNTLLKLHVYNNNLQLIQDNKLLLHQQKVTTVFLIAFKSQLILSVDEIKYILFSDKTQIDSSTPLQIILQPIYYNFNAAFNNIFLTEIFQNDMIVQIQNSQCQKVKLKLACVFNDNNIRNYQITIKIYQNSIQNKMYINFQFSRELTAFTLLNEAIDIKSISVQIKGLDGYGFSLHNVVCRSNDVLIISYQGLLVIFYENTVYHIENAAKYTSFRDGKIIFYNDTQNILYIDQQNLYCIISYEQILTVMIYEKGQQEFKQEWSIQFDLELIEYTSNNQISCTIILQLLSCIHQNELNLPYQNALITFIFNNDFGISRSIYEVALYKKQFFEKQSLFNVQIGLQIIFPVIYDKINYKILQLKKIQCDNNIQYLICNISTDVNSTIYFMVNGVQFSSNISINIKNIEGNYGIEQILLTRKKYIKQKMESIIQYQYIDYEIMIGIISIVFIQLLLLCILIILIIVKIKSDH